MCRLLLISDTTEDLAFRQAVLTHMMTIATADGDQTDGWGITDGIYAARASWSFLRQGANAIHEFRNADRMMLGHVRKASRGTSITPNEAHPFRFDNHAAPFWLAHNGYVNETGSSANNEPNSDTYRVGRRLETLLGGQLITTDVLTDWACEFGHRSEYAFMIMQGDTAHVIRGQRPMSYMQFGKGCIFATHRLILENLVEFLRYWDRKIAPEIVDLEENTIATVVANEQPMLQAWGARNKPERRAWFLRYADQWERQEV